MDTQNNAIEEKVWHHVITTEDLGNLKCKIKVTYDSIGTQMALDKACELVKKQSQVKGFRKGKAPIQLVKNYYQKEINNAASSMLSNEGFLHACYEQKIVPITKPEVKDAEFKIDGTFVCDIFVDLKPTINPTGYVGIQLQKQDIDIEPIINQITQEIKSKCMKKEEVLEINEGNTAIIDFDVYVNNNQISTGRDHNFTILKGQEPPFGENLIGMVVGETKEENIILPETSKQYAGQSATIKLTLKSVHKMVDASDEEIIKFVGCSTQDELNNLIKQHGNIEKQKREMQGLEEQIVDKLIELHEFDVPEEWVVNEEKYIMQQLNLQHNTDHDFKKYIRNMSERNVRRTFIIDAIYDAESHLNITKEEINEVIKQEAERRKVSTLIVKKDMQKKNVYDSVVGAIKQRKVMDFLLKNAQIEDNQDNIINNVIEVPENPFE